VLSTIIGIAILLVIIYAAFKLLKSILMSLTLLAFAFLAFYLIYGFVPNPRQIPILGPYLPEIPTLTDLLSYIRGFFYKLEIQSVTRDVEGNLLVTVRNSGRLKVSGLSVFVDGKEAEVLNEPKDPLPSGESTVLQVRWKAGFERIEVRAGEASAVLTSDQYI
jgi:hypothetical protein